MLLFQESVVVVSNKITLLGSFSSFQFHFFFIFCEVLRTFIKWSLHILNWTIHHKVVGTEFIISLHTFQCEDYCFLLVLESLIKYHKGDLAGHCSIKLYQLFPTISQKGGLYPLI